MLFIRSSNGAYIRVNDLPGLVTMRERVIDSGIFISGASFVAVEFLVRPNIVSSGLYAIDSQHEILTANTLVGIPLSQYATRQVGVRIGTATLSLYAIEKATRVTVRTRRIAWEELRLFLTP